MTSPWDPQSEQIVIQMHADGAVFGSIAAALREKGYPVTRNAVAGKVHRMKLPPRPKEEHPLKSQRRPMVTVCRSLEQKPSVVRSRPLWTAPLPSTYGPDSVPFMEIVDGQCKAIIAYRDGQISKAMCCGHKTRRVVIRGKVRAKPWCDYHESIYTQEPYR